MKHLILFEAFKSAKLSKTLSYIKDDKKFLDYIKRVANYYDFPISELSDDMFQYLPFSAALAVKKEKDITPIKCDYESDWISGEYCDGGRVKRTWGKGIRYIECPKCKGKGTLTPKVEGELKYLKFWFTSEGKLVAMTAVDGLKDERQGKPINDSRHYLAPSENLSDYKLGPSFEPSELNRSGLSTGDIVKTRICTHNFDTIGTIYKPGSILYFINNRVSGISPTGNNWKKYGRYSWRLGSNDHSAVTKLIPIKKDSKDSNYAWNHRVEINRYSIEIEKGYNIENDLSDAHFALILDVDLLKTTGYKKVSDIRAERSDTISGALSQLKDQDVKNANIERYIDVISKKFDIDEGFKNITKIAPRLYCDKYALYYLYYYSNDSFGEIISSIYNLIKNKDRWNNSEINYTLDSIKYILRSKYRENMTLSEIYYNNINYIRKRLNDEGKDNYIKVLDSMRSLSNLISDKILRMEVETLEDMEIMYGKLQALRNIIKGNRYTISKLFYFFDYIRRPNDPDKPYRCLVGYLESELINDFVKDCEIISNIVNKM
jgi:hypothetical protein